MSAADELYLLFQQCNDLGNEQILAWNEHFEWLDEVLNVANERHGQPVIPKTPMTSRTKRKKLEPTITEENKDPKCMEPPTVLRKSSRTAAKNATQKTKKALEEISNLGSKLRRPSSPKTEIVIQLQKLNNPEVSERKYSEDIKIVHMNPSHRVEFDVPKEDSSTKRERSDSGIYSEKISDVCEKERPEEEVLQNIVEEELDSKHNIEIEHIESATKHNIENDHIDSGNKNNIETNHLESANSHNKEIDLNIEIEHIESATKHNIGNDHIDSANKHNIKTNYLKSANKHNIESANNHNKEIDHLKSFIKQNRGIDHLELVNNDTICKMPPPPSPKALLIKPITEAILKDCQEPLPKPTENEESYKNQQSIKMKRQVEENPARVTRTKRRKIEEDEKANKEEEETKVNPLVIAESPKINSATKAPVEACKRITRSKVKQMNKIQNSPITGETWTPKTMKQHLQSSVERKNQRTKITNKISETPPRSPFANKKQNNRNVEYNEVATDVQEISIENTEVTKSPFKVIKHSVINEKSTTSKKVLKSNLTPTTSNSLYKGIINSSHFSAGSSGRIRTNSFQHRNPITSASPNVSNNSKIFVSTTDSKKNKNLVIGLTSFINKAQPTKLTREESEEKKQDELKRKKEKEEEIRRKKEEMMKNRAEEQKRKNEERMRRVHETREARERKAAEARLLQEKEKKLREERLKDEREKKRQAAVAKAEEAAKQQRLKEQEERMRKLEEQKKAEERRIRMEEQARLMEQKREKERLAKEEYEKQKAKEEFERQKAKEEYEKQKAKEEFERQKAKEEYKKQKAREEYERQKAKEAERLERERAKEAERIQREKQELELLKEKEKTLSKDNANATYCLTPKENVANATFSKPPEIQSYEITPDVKKPKNNKSDNPDDYDINDLRSDDSTDEECAPKKHIPVWAKGDQLRKNIFNQEFYPPNVDSIFPPQDLLKMPDLSAIFVRKRSRFFKRTSSAVWNTPPHKIGIS